MFQEGRRPRLVVTSPPYPGVHVLYHRWQLHGGKETPAPFWIANRLDGDGAAYYTMGDRGSHAAGKYFEELQAALRSVAAVCDSETTVVQVVAFSDPVWQLPRYLSVADDVGRTPAQVALNWCTAKPNIIVIPKSNSVARTEENCGASGWRLTEEQHLLLDEAFPA